MQPEAPCKSANQPCVNWWAEVMERTATHYAELAKKPAWRAYAKARVLEMEEEHGGHWVGLLALVRKKLEADKSLK